MAAASDSTTLPTIAPFWRADLEALHLALVQLELGLAGFATYVEPDAETRLRFRALQELLDLARPAAGDLAEAVGVARRP